MAIDNYISELTLPNNSTVYKIKDIEAREELEKKQDILEWDSYPQEGSLNPVTSDGLYSEFSKTNHNIPTKVSDLTNDLGYVKSYEKIGNAETFIDNVSGGGVGPGYTRLAYQWTAPDSSSADVRTSVKASNNVEIYGFASGILNDEEINSTTSVYANPVNKESGISASNNDDYSYIAVRSDQIEIGGSGNQFIDINGLVDPETDYQAVHKKYVDDTISNISISSHTTGISISPHATSNLIGVKNTTTKAITQSVSNHTLIFSEVTVPIKNDNSTTVVTSSNHIINDGGHTHNISI